MGDTWAAWARLVLEDEEVGHAEGGGGGALVTWLGLGLGLR